eukprot:4902570-Lingulodinium_polyedra.AAC.1
MLHNARARRKGGRAPRALVRHASSARQSMLAMSKRLMAQQGRTASEASLAIRTDQEQRSRRNSCCRTSRK